MYNFFRGAIIRSANKLLNRSLKVSHGTMFFLVQTFCKQLNLWNNDVANRYNSI